MSLRGRRVRNGELGKVGMRCRGMGVGFRRGGDGRVNGTFGGQNPVS